MMTARSKKNVSKKAQQKDFLVALQPTPRDLQISIDKKYYRIPCDSKAAPMTVLDNTLKYIAFYQPKSFGSLAHIIQWFAEVDSITTASRKELFPNEVENKKSSKLYYKIMLRNVERLEKPIVAKRPRRLLFINTNYDRFINAEEINDLFFESPLEEKMWKELKKERIPAERQFFTALDSRKIILDFALFCKARKLAVECDGDSFHTSKQHVFRDKKRDNILEKYGWNVLRYTSNDINKDLKNTITQVKETVNKYGGIEDNYTSNDFRYLFEDDELRLFE